ncbi:MAG: 1-acyl-sn-glycerol-3-phosphate acyltransferase [Clostridia bacterium]|nr:1-acyl-sn-glycerol-3-phosphate acyltransferase [Clostridia bacterium]
MSFYRGIYKVFAPLVKLVYRITAEGVENIPAGGAILAANHTAFSDPIVISAAARRQVRYMAKKELFHFPLGPIIRSLGAYPVDRGGADVGSIRRTIEMIEEGELIGIFPQGHRRGGEDIRNTEIKPGVGMFAWHTKAAVVPVFIGNKRMKTGLFRKNRVVFGKPLLFEDLLFERGGKTEYLTASRLVFSRICALAYPDDVPEALPGSGSEPGSTLSDPVKQYASDFGESPKDPDAGLPPDGPPNGREKEDA